MLHDFFIPVKKINESNYYCKCKCIYELFIGSIYIMIFLFFKQQKERKLQWNFKEKKIKDSLKVLFLGREFDQPDVIFILE